jgi:hypothetical protein
MQDAKTSRHLTDAELAHIEDVAARYRRWRRQVDAEIKQGIHRMMDRIGSSLFDSPPRHEGEPNAQNPISALEQNPKP